MSILYIQVQQVFKRFKVVLPINYGSDRWENQFLINCISLFKYTLTKAKKKYCIKSLKNEVVKN